MIRLLAPQTGNFVGLVHAFVKFNNTLAEHLGLSTVFSSMSNTIQNDIIESIAHIIQDETDKEIRKSPFIAVQVDDTSDVDRTGWSTWPSYPLTL